MTDYLGLALEDFRDGKPETLEKYIREQPCQPQATLTNHFLVREDGSIAINCLSVVEVREHYWRLLRLPGEGFNFSYQVEHKGQELLNLGPEDTHTFMLPRLSIGAQFEVPPKK